MGTRGSRGSGESVWGTDLVLTLWSGGGGGSLGCGAVWAAEVGITGVCVKSWMINPGGVTTCAGMNFRSHQSLPGIGQTAGPQQLLLSCPI